MRTNYTRRTNCHAKIAERVWVDGAVMSLSHMIQVMSLKTSAERSCAQMQRLFSKYQFTSIPSHIFVEFLMPSHSLILSSLPPSVSFSFFFLPFCSLLKTVKCSLVLMRSSPSDTSHTWLRERERSGDMHMLSIRTLKQQRQASLSPLLSKFIPEEYIS